MGSRYGSILVHTKDVFNLWQHGVAKHLQIGPAIDVPVKKVWPNKVAPHYSEPYKKLFSRRGFVQGYRRQSSGGSPRGAYNGRRCG